MEQQVNVFISYTVCTLGAHGQIIAHGAWADEKEAQDHAQLAEGFVIMGAYNMVADFRKPAPEPRDPVADQFVGPDPENAGSVPFLGHEVPSGGGE